MKTVFRTALAGAVAAALCGGMDSASAITVDSSFEGAWQIDGANNRGILLDYLPEQNLLFAAYFTYDSEGNQLWTVGASSVSPGKNKFEFDMVTHDGGSFLDSVQPGAEQPVGTATLKLDSCSTGSFSFQSGGDFSDLESGEVGINYTGLAGSECVYTEEFDGCPAGTSSLDIDQGGLEYTACALSGTITGDMTLSNDTIYVLNGPVFFGEDMGASGDEGDTLTIEPGTIISGAAEGAGDALFISRGNKLDVNGAPNAPVVMTSSNGIFDVANATPQGWGGLVINGRAPLNSCTSGVCESQGEGASGLYGGDEPADSSGSIQYLRVEFAGDLVSDVDELNGIAFQGVGSGTSVNHVQVHGTADDGIEFFGGTVSVKNVVLTDVGDDSLDWTEGWQGNVQYAIVDQFEGSDRGIEADNLEGDNDAEPRSFARIANATFIGNNAENSGITLRRGTGAFITNSIVVGPRGGACIDIDDQATFDNADSENGIMFHNMVVNCTTQDNFEEQETADIFNEGMNNVEADPMLSGFVPGMGSPAWGIGDIDRSSFGMFFDNTDYAGAIGPNQPDWTLGWTRFLND